MSRQTGLPTGLSELRLRIDELAGFEPEASTVFIVKTRSPTSHFPDLIEDRYGHWVQLEQEHVRFSLVRRALEPWTA